VRFLHNLSVAAQLGVRVVDVESAAGGWLALLVVLAFHVPVAADVALRVVGLSATTASVVAVLGMNLAVATDMGVLVVRAVTTAARAVVILAFQIALATDVLLNVVEFAATAALPVLVVDLVSTASAV